MDCLTDISSYTKLGRYSVSISGLVMRKILAGYVNSDLRLMFVKVLMEAETVILYRSTPAEKAELVKLVRHTLPHKKTLAIGDGTNDVNMIQTAHIGVGIRGKEGTQASSFADYAIPQFQDLRRLLFWHGRGFGRRLRLGTMIFMFKAMLYSTATFYLQLYNGYSGFQPMPTFIHMMYDVNLTTIACGFFAVFAHDVSFARSRDETGLPIKMSKMFFICREKAKTFYRDYFTVICGVQGVSALEFYVYRRSQTGNGGIMNINGQVTDLYAYGILTISVVVCAQHFLITKFMPEWNAVYAFIFVFSFCQTPLVFFMAQSIPESELRGAIFSQILSSPVFVLQLVLVVSITGFGFVFLHKMLAFLEESLRKAD